MRIKEFLLRARRKILTISVFLFSVFLFLSLWALWYEPSSLIVKNYDLKIADWNPAHDNLKIVAISDIHGGSNFIDEEKIKKVAALANEQNPDLIVLLGDFVSERFFKPRELKMPMSAIADSLAGLKAKHGVFAVIGNHDLEYGDKTVKAEMERVGIRVLDAESVTLNINGENLTVVGLPEYLKYNNPQKYSDDSHAALAGSDADANILGLVHNPDTINLVTKQYSISPNLRLILAGHTHGGQVRLPVIGSIIVPSNYGQKYALGETVENGVALFVTTGVGTSIFPVRFRVLPEISVLWVSGK